MKPDLLVTMPMPDGYAELLAEDFTIHHHPRVAADDPVLDRIGPAIRAVLCNGTYGIENSVVDRLQNVEIISCFGAGYENLDVAALRARGIAMSYGPGTNAHSVADLAICLMMVASRNIIAAERAARAGRWAEARGATPTISRRRLGILGLGRIGSGVARRAEACDMKIAYHNRTPRKDAPYRYVDNLVTLAAGSDYLVVSCPGGPETRHIVDDVVLEALGPEGYLINVARGSIVDTGALIAALGARTIAGAAIDVYENEPDIPEALRALDNVVLTPHIAGNAADATHAKYELYMENIRAHLAGEPLPTPVP